MFISSRIPTKRTASKHPLFDNPECLIKPSSPFCWDWKGHLCIWRPSATLIVQYWLWLWFYIIGFWLHYLYNLKVCCVMITYKLAIISISILLYRITPVKVMFCYNVTMTQLHMYKSNNWSTGQIVQWPDVLTNQLIWLKPQDLLAAFRYNANTGCNMKIVMSAVCQRYLVKT